MCLGFASSEAVLDGDKDAPGKRALGPILNICLVTCYI